MGVQAFSFHTVILDDTMMIPTAQRGNSYCSHNGNIVSVNVDHYMPSIPHKKKLQNLSCVDSSLGIAPTLSANLVKK